MARKRRPAPQLPRRAPSRPLPPLAHALPPKLRPLLAAYHHGTSIRGVTAFQHALLETTPELAAIPALRAQLSRSSTAVGIDFQELRAQVLSEFNGRRLDSLDLAAIVMDGTPVGGEQLLWAIGVTREGVKIPLGVTAIPAESAQAVAKFVASLHDRGLDTSSVLWLVDGHLGLHKGIAMATRGRGAIQLCRVHKQRNVLSGLDAKQRKAHHAEIAKRMQKAWAQSDHAVAAAELEQLARWLDGKGFTKAAASARHDIALTLTLQRVGIEDPELLSVLGSTNAIESANSSVSAVKKRTKLFGKEMGKAPRQGTVAIAVAGAERRWKPVVDDPAQLAAVPLAVVRSRYAAGIEWLRDAEDGGLEIVRLPAETHLSRPLLRELLSLADRDGRMVTLDEYAFGDPDVAEAMLPWLERCGFAADGTRAPQPPGALAWTQVAPVDLDVRPLAVPSRVPGDARAAAAAREALGLDGAEQASRTDLTWTGSAAALDAFGLRPGALTVEQLTTVLTGRRLDGPTVREGAPQRLAQLDGAQLDGAPAGKVTSVMSVAWELAAPAPVAERWLLAEPADRARLEEALADGARAALGRLYGNPEIATAMAVERGRTDDFGLRVRGVVIGVMHDGKVRSPWAEDLLPRDEKLEWACAEAADLVAGMLDAELARMGPAPGLALPRGLDEPWTHEDVLAVLGEERGGALAARAEQLRGDVLADMSLTALKQAHQHEHQKESDPFARIDRAGAAEALALERRIAALQAAGRDDPALSVLERRLEALRAEGRHPDRWLDAHAEAAAKRLALEQERAARAGAFAKDGGVVDRLEPYREALGGRRLRQLAERAHERAGEWAAQPTEWLQARDAELAEGLRRIDRDAARTLHEVERTRAELARQPDPGPDIAARLRRLDEVEQGLHLGGRHPDDWLARHGDAAADRVAVQALLSKRQREVAQETAPARRAVEPALEPPRAQPPRMPAGMEM